jgi:hypothetical protein
MSHPAWGIGRDLLGRQDGVLVSVGVGVAPVQAERFVADGVVSSRRLGEHLLTNPFHLGSLLNHGLNLTDDRSKGTRLLLGHGNLVDECVDVGGVD